MESLPIDLWLRRATLRDKDRDKTPEPARLAQIVTWGHRQSVGASEVETAKIIRPTDTAYAEPIRKLGIAAEQKLAQHASPRRHRR